MNVQRLYNPLVRWLLRSPLHRSLSGSTLLLTYTGRHSGQERSLPVNYLWDGESLLLVGARAHAWWRNLRGGVPVRMRLQGRDYAGVATAFEGDAAMTDGGLLTLLRRVPRYRTYWQVALDAAGNPEEPQALSRIAAENTLVRIGALRPVA
jgi:deazaflavin-dependent oxidoreductase (nitroreductase family)